MLQCSQSAGPGAGVNSRLSEKVIEALIWFYSCTQSAKVPDPFPIPTFRKHTQTRLVAQQLTPDDRKYMVSVLGTMPLTYIEKAFKRQCLSVAQSLVRKYPFLKEPV